MQLENTRKGIGLQSGYNVLIKFKYAVVISNKYQNVSKRLFTTGYRMF